MKIAPKDQPDFPEILKQLKAMGTTNPHSRQAQELFGKFRLSSQDRLFFCLWANPTLRSAHFADGAEIARRGGHVLVAHVVIVGEMKASDGKYIFDLGPGAVIGLAEGLAEVPQRLTVTAITPVETHVIPFRDAQYQLTNVNPGLRGIFRSSTARTLAMTETVKALA
ncbi:MAG: cyclic nucleotide-binding domain-containing protein [Betaproteobacteria bacterium]|jgi:CRP-like cAMP-binding protein|nr:cyclic nucleotide-binding domain-containing protein [Betaproteobacteria bacterium]